MIYNDEQQGATGVFELWLPLYFYYTETELLANTESLQLFVCVCVCCVWCVRVIL